MGPVPKNHKLAKLNEDKIFNPNNPITCGINWIHKLKAPKKWKTVQKN